MITIPGGQIVETVAEAFVAASLSRNCPNCRLGKAS
jgi:hypothetical protein